MALGVSAVLAPSDEPARPEAPSRRAVLGAAAVAAGTVALRAASPAAAGKPRRRSTPVTHDAAVHLARRITYGPTPQLVDHIRSVGVGAYLEEQLQPDTVPDPLVSALAAAFPLVSLPAAVVAEAGSTSAAIRQLQGLTLVRAVGSERQLLEVMVDFWSNHLNINVHHPLAGLYKPTDDADVVRQHALGSFTDMLVASAHSPAMLTYLDNFRSTGANPNENYGRELLELHTLGVHGGYTERDVRGVARALTGWGVNGTTGRFEYSAKRHYVGRLRVLGWQHPNDDSEAGEEVGTSLLTYLAHHPSTARFLAYKLCRRFVADLPPMGLVDRVARAYLANDTQIVPTLRVIFASKEFAAGAGSKVRRPAEYVVAAARALGCELVPQKVLGAHGSSLIALVQGVGQVPFEWVTPDGYPDVAVRWVSAGGSIRRWNAVQRLLAGGVAELTAPDGAAILGSSATATATTSTVPATAGQLVDRVASRVVFQRMAGPDRAALLRYLGRSERDALSEADARAVAPELAALALCSPYGQVR